MTPADITSITGRTPDRWTSEDIALHTRGQQVIRQPARQEPERVSGCWILPAALAGAALWATLFALLLGWRLW